MFSAKQARFKSQSYNELAYSYEIESDIRHKVLCGEFKCYFPVSKEQQVYDSLVGKGFNITKGIVPHSDNEFEDDPKDHIFIEYIKVEW